MKKNYTYSETHQEKDYGKNYDANIYDIDTTDSRLWEVEKNVIQEIVSGMPHDISILDFACGTGRICQFFEQLGFENIDGVDISSEMLSQAEKKLKKTHLSERNLSEKPMGKSYTLISSFRFFLNADDALRDQILKVLYTHLEDDGRLILNIHANSFSWAGFILKIQNFMKALYFFLTKKTPEWTSYKNTMSRKSFQRFLEKNGFSVKNTYSYGFLPYSMRLNYLSREKFIRLETKWITKNKYIFGRYFLVECTKKEKREF